MTKTLISRPRPSLVCKTKTQDQHLFVMYTRGRPKSIFLFSAVNENADENEISFTAENEKKTDIHFRPKNESESHLITSMFFFFFIHSVTKSALQCAANTSSSFAFFAGGPLTGFHFPHVQYERGRVSRICQQIQQINRTTPN